MSGRPSAAVENAVRAVKLGSTPKDAYMRYGVSESGLRAALRRHGVPALRNGRPRKTPTTGESK